MDQQGHKIDQKGLKMYEKGKNRVFGPKIPPSSGMFLSGIGGYPPPPFGGYLPAQKPFGNREVPPL